MLCLRRRSVRIELGALSVQRRASLRQLLLRCRCGVGQVRPFGFERFSQLIVLSLGSFGTFVKLGALNIERRPSLVQLLLRYRRLFS